MTYCDGLASVASVVRRHLLLKNYGSNLNQIWCVAVDKETRNCKFHDPTPTQRGGNFGVKCVKLLYFFLNILLYPQALIRQTKYVVMMIKEGST